MISFASNEVESEQIRGIPRPACYLCGSAGEILYDEMPDRLFGVSGKWTVRRCPSADCGLLWLDPVPLTDDIPKLYRTYYTHDTAAVTSTPANDVVSLSDFMKAAYYAERFGRADLEKPCRPQPGLVRKLASLPGYLHPLFQARIQFPLAAIARRPKGRLLDVGSGSGNLLILAEKLGWQATGVDFDPQAVATATAKGLLVHCGSLEEQSFADGSFDLITMTHVIEHLDDPVRTLRECRRVLAPDGALLVSTPNVRSWGHTVFEKCWIGLDVPRHIYVFGSASLQRVAQSAGFSQVSTSTAAPFTQFIFQIGSTLQTTNLRRSRWEPSFWLGKIPFRMAFLAEILMMRWQPSVGEELIMEASG